MNDLGVRHHSVAGHAQFVCPECSFPISIPLEKFQSSEMDATFVHCSLCPHRAWPIGLMREFWKQCVDAQEYIADLPANVFTLPVRTGKV